MADTEAVRNHVFLAQLPGYPQPADFLTQPTEEPLIVRRDFPAGSHSSTLAEYEQKHHEQNCVLRDRVMGKGVLHMARKRWIIPVLFLAGSALAEKQESTAAASIPAHYDALWMGDHTAEVTAVRDSTIYFKNPWFITTEYIDAEVTARQEADFAKRLASEKAAQPGGELQVAQEFKGRLSIESVQVGQRYDVVRVVVLVRDRSSSPIEINALKIGDATITDIRKDILVAKYTGQIISLAKTGRDGEQYVIVINRRRFR